MTSMRASEHRETASRAGLRYVTDGVAGISRRRAGKNGWIFFSPGGGRITSPAERERLAGLAIPPAWSDVWICPDPRGHIPAPARDVRGRKQYRYHPPSREAPDQSQLPPILHYTASLPAIP